MNYHYPHLTSNTTSQSTKPLPFRGSPSRRSSLTWRELVALEPGLRALERHVRSTPPSQNQAARERLWQAFRCRLRCYVGQFARRSELRSAKALRAARARLRRLYSTAQKRCPATT